ncbi:MAG TPA: YceI family protein [Gemmatimonadales bacterium]|nr:YceI family protein [Gemmatimonadales bacterium]
MRPARLARLAVPLVVAAAPLAGQTGASATWILARSKVTYHVSHPLHQTDGVSYEARGKGVCQSGQCTLLIAAPVKSFNSGDSNRDLHMLQVVRGAQYPMVVVRTTLPEDAAGHDTIYADVEIEFAGQTAHYKQVLFQLTMQGNDATVVGTIPVTLTDFKIDPPSLLMIAVKNEVPVRVEMLWRKE